MHFLAGTRVYTDLFKSKVRMVVLAVQNLQKACSCSAVEFLVILGEAVLSPYALLPHLYDGKRQHAPYSTNIRTNAFKPVNISTTLT